MFVSVTEYVCFSDKGSSSSCSLDVLHELDIATSTVAEEDIAVMREVAAMISQRAAYIVAAGLSVSPRFIYTSSHELSNCMASLGPSPVIMHSCLYRANMHHRNGT